MSVLTQSALEAWGTDIGANMDPPLFITLSGDLGAGKSVFARAVARGAGVTGTMPSPTYNLLFRYPGARGIDVVHIDLYRLEREADVWELGWRELGDVTEIVLVEWPERAAGILPADRWDIRLDSAGEHLRRVTCSRAGDVRPLPPMPVSGDA